MGAANVIPGVSGGTIAFITNIYEELIHSLKSLNLVAIRYFFTLKWKEFSRYINLPFLAVLFAGVFISILSLGKLLGFLFDFYPVFIWAFFFGLILASVYYVGRTITSWNVGAILSLLAGMAVALIIAFMSPASENSHVIYLFICGVVAMASMLLPGLSGSFVLILMGNYQLIFLSAVPELNLRILIPVVLGSIVGFVILSRIVSFLLGHYKDRTISLLTGFILGSLLIIWPWKHSEYLKDASGEIILRNGKEIIEGYSWFLPDFQSIETFLAILFIILGIVVVVFIEKFVQKSEK